MDEKHEHDMRPSAESDECARENELSKSHGFMDDADSGAPDYRRLSVDWFDFDLAYQTVAEGGEVEAYLNQKTGKIIIIFSDDENEEELRGEVEEEWDDWLQIEKMDSHTAFKLRERFAFSREEANAQKLLEEALSGPRPFRRFKDVLQRDEDLRQEWFAFEAAVEKEVIEDWFASHGIQVDWKTRFAG